MTTPSTIIDDIQSRLEELRSLVTTPVPVPEPPKPEPPKPAIRHCNGIYLLDPGEENRNYSEADLRLPEIDGGTIRFRRPWVMKGGGVADWTFVDDYVAIHRKVGKPYTLLCMAGDHPRPWEDDNINAYLDLIGWAGVRYAKDPLCAGWHVTGCSPQGTSEELHWENGKFTDAILTGCKVLTGTSAISFPNCDILQAISGKDKSDRIEQLVKYGAEVAPGRYRVKNNNLKAIEIDAWHNKRLVDNAKDPRVLIGFEPAGSYFYESSRMGAGNVNDMINQGREMARRAGKNPEDALINVYWPDRNSILKSKLK